MEPSTLVKACSWRLWVGLKIQVTGCVFLIPHISITKMVAPCGVYVLTRVLFLIVSLTHCHVSEMVKNLPAVQEAKVQSLGREGPLERGMATNSRTLAWIIPWTGEPGRLQSMGSHRVRHDWATSLSFFPPSSPCVWYLLYPRSVCIVSSLSAHLLMDSFQVVSMSWLL